MSQGCPEFNSETGLSRRRMLQAGTAGIAGLALPSILRAEQTSVAHARGPSTSFYCTSLAGRRTLIRLT